MAHFAKVEEGIVMEVIVIGDNDAPDEVTGQAFIAEVLGLDGEWLQTSYNSNGNRGMYAGPGMAVVRGKFYPKREPIEGGPWKWEPMIGEWSEDV